MTGGPGSIWGVLYGASAAPQYVNFEVDEEGLWLEGFLTLDADQARLLYEAMHTYYSEEAN